MCLSSTASAGDEHPRLPVVPLRKLFSNSTNPLTYQPHTPTEREVEREGGIKRETTPTFFRLLPFGLKIFSLDETVFHHWPLVTLFEMYLY